MTFNHIFLFFLGILITCVANTDAREAIINGDKAGVDQFPYQVSVTTRGRNVCGGGIIGNQFIITAAHCFIKMDREFYKIQTPVLAGTNDLHRKDEPAMPVEVKKIYVLKEFNPRQPAFGDIAVLKLKHPLQLSKHIKKLELPKSGENFDGKTAVIAGFGWHWIHYNGRDREGGSNDTQLRFVEVDILDHYPHDADKIKLTDDLIHAKVKQTDSSRPRGICVGDSGSPLVYGNTIVGILNRATQSCTEHQDIGGIYARVSHFLEFIEYAINDKPHEFIRSYEFPHGSNLEG